MNFDKAATPARDSPDDSDVSARWPHRQVRGGYGRSTVFALIFAISQELCTPPNALSDFKPIARATPVAQATTSDVMRLWVQSSHRRMLMRAGRTNA